MPPILHPTRLPPCPPFSLFLSLFLRPHPTKGGSIPLVSSPSFAKSGLLAYTAGVGKRKKMDSSLEAEIDRLSRPPGEADPSEPSTGTVPTTILQPQNGRLAGGDGDYPVMVPQVPGAQQPRLSRGSSGSSSGGNLRPRGSGGLTSAGDET